MPEEAGVNFPFWIHLHGMLQCCVKIFLLPCRVPLESVVLFLQTV